jgi:hypothetical protein
MIPIPKDHQERIAAMVTKIGSVSGAARMLRTSVLTVAKAAGGQAVSRGTRALIEKRIRELEVAAKAP